MKALRNVLLTVGLAAASLAGPSAVDFVQGSPSSASPAGRQDDDPPAPSTRELVQREVAILRSRASDPDDLDQAGAALLDLGPAGARALAQHASKELKSLRKQNRSAEAKLLKGFDKRARAVLKKRLDRKALAEVDQYRGVILKIKVSDGLTKARIKAESDPAYEKVRALLSVSVIDVWEADQELYAAWVELLGSVEAESRWLVRWSDARDLLLEDPEHARAAKRLKAPERPPVDGLGMTAAFAWRAVLATPMRDSDRRILMANEVVAADIDSKEADGIRALNVRRIIIGLNAQSIDVKLCAAGRGHSQDMKEHDFFAHKSPLPGKRSFGDRASLAGTSANAENIASGTASGEGVIMQWWYSPGHHKNMLGGQSLTGLGRFASHWTQMFN